MVVAITVGKVVNGKALGCEVSGDRLGETEMWFKMYFARLYLSISQNKIDTLIQYLF